MAIVVCLSPSIALISIGGSVIAGRGLRVGQPTDRATREPTLAARFEQLL
jgi:hypothetical protein